ncbi:MAG TPA: glutathione S-transferase N-terminal domain-containing protein [Polyangiaceae bacterium]|nr:glutathione S-transferase N-terminal domain-containing protein [Polyangiaceae bacterium]
MSQRAPSSHAPANPPALVLCEFVDPGLPTHESYSPFCLKVHRALRAAGLPYERRHGQRPVAFKDLNPALQVPILLVGGEPVHDSTRILARIEELAPPARPLDARTRAEALLWEELADTSLSAFLVAARWADERNWPAVEAAYFGAMPPPVRADVVPGLRANVLDALYKRDVWRLGPEACWRRFDEVLDQLELRAPDEGYWLGPSLSAADFGLFAQLFSFCTALTPWQHEALRRRPRLARYVDRVDAATRAPAA